MVGDAQVSRKRKFVQDGIFRAELNEFLSRTLAEDGYAGVQVRAHPLRTEIIVKATRSREVLGEKGRRIRELTSLVQKRFGYDRNDVELYADKVANRGQCAMAQAESLRYKLLQGLAVRRACFAVVRNIMESGAKGCEIIVSGKLRGQRAKSMKFTGGYILSTGEPIRDYVDKATRCVKMRTGMLGIKVKIMLPNNPRNAKATLPDSVVVHEVKLEPPQMLVPTAPAEEDAVEKSQGVVTETPDYPAPVIAGGF